MLTAFHLARYSQPLPPMDGAQASGEVAAWRSLVVYRPTLSPSWVWPSSDHLLQSLFPLGENEKKGGGVPWRSSGGDSVLSPQRAWVQSLVGELRSHKTHGVAEKEKKEKGGSHGSGLRGGSRTWPHPGRLPLQG